MSNFCLRVSPLVLLLAGVCSLEAQTIRLAYQFKAGELEHFKESSKTVMSSAMMPGGSQTFTNETWSSQKVERVMPDGNAEEIRTIDSTTSTMNGKPFENPNTKDAVGLPLKVSMTTSGKVLNVQAAQDSLDEHKKELVLALRSQIMSQPSFPSHPVRENDSWQDSTGITQQTQLGALRTVIRYTTTVQGIDTVAGILVRVLRMAVSLSGSIEGGAGTVNGNGEGSLYFSEKLGKELKSTLTIDQTMNLNSPQGSLTMSITTSTTRELLK